MSWKSKGGLILASASLLLTIGCCLFWLAKKPNIFKNVAGLAIYFYTTQVCYHDPGSSDSDFIGFPLENADLMSAFDEPLSSAFKITDGEAYRFAVLRPFHLTTSVIRVNIQPDGSGIVVLKQGKRLSQNQQFQVTKETRQINPEQADRLRRKLRQVGFFRAPSRCYYAYPDYSVPVLIYEVRTAQGYHWIERPVGKLDQKEELEELFMQLVGRPDEKLY
jgi:hypothetical protein